MPRIDDFEDKGRYRRIRNAYFKKRDGRRILELQKLSEDVDYAFVLLESISRRTKEPSMVSVPLRNLSMRLFYMNNRKYFRTDNAIIRNLANIHHLHPDRVRAIVFHKEIPDLWYIKQEKGGFEEK